MRTKIVCFLITGIMIAAAPVAGADRADINCAADAAGCCCRGSRGNVDCDFNDEIDIIDLTMLIDHLFITLAPLPSVDEANVDGLDEIDIADLTRLIDFLYISLAPLSGCPDPVNHPPVTILLGKDSTLQPFINAITPTATNSGVHVSWIGQDKLDHPYEPEPLSYQWRVYGPYDSATYVSIVAQFRKFVFLSTAGEVIRKGQGNYVVYCDTAWLPTPPYLQLTCDTLVIDTITVANRFGTLDTIFDVEAAGFDLNPEYNKVALRSGTSGDSTTTDTSTYLMNFFNNAPSDTTQEGNFIFWVRAIDDDVPPKADPTPPFEKIKVIDGKHERDILIADAQISYEINPRVLSKAILFWAGAVNRWKPGTPYTYHRIPQANGNILPAKMLLQHKIVLIVNDDVIKGVLSTPGIVKSVIAAMRAGTSIWICGRSHLAGDEDRPPDLFNFAPLYEIGPWLGLSAIASSGWDWYALKDPSVRIEDFVGAEPVISATWPTLSVDSGYLHSRYGWGGDFYFPFVPSLSALPEVTFFNPVPEAEILYTYKSLYAGHHPLVSDDFFFAGKPVVYRLDRDAYRLMVSSFTPYAMASDSVGGSAQVFIDSVFNWLYEPYLQPTALGAALRLDRDKSDWNEPPAVGSIPTDVVEVKP